MGPLSVPDGCGKSRLYREAIPEEQDLDNDDDDDDDDNGDYDDSDDYDYDDKRRQSVASDVSIYCTAASDCFTRAQQ